MRRPCRAFALLLLLSTAPSSGQQVIGHVPLLPADAGLNPSAPLAIVPDPLAPQVFVAHTRGVSAVVRGGAPRMVNIDTGGPSLPYAFYSYAVLDSARRRLYVSHGDGATPGDVAVVDADTHAILARVALPFSPGQMFLDPVRQRLFVNNQVAFPSVQQVVAMIDTAWLGVRPTTLPNVIGINLTTGKIYARDTLGATPNLLFVYNPDLTLGRTLDLQDPPSLVKVDETRGRVFVAITLNVVILDATTDQELARPETYFTSDMVVDPASGYLYTVGFSDLIQWIDLANQLKQYSIGLGQGAELWWVALDPAGRRLFVYHDVFGRSYRSAVAAFDIGLNTPSRIGTCDDAGTWLGEMAWSPATGRLYVSSPDDAALREVDPSNLTGTTIPLGASLFAGAVNPTTGVGFFPDLATNRVAAVRLTATPALLASAAVGVYPTRSAVSVPRGEAYIVSPGSGTMAVLDAASGAPLRTVTLPDPNTVGFALDTALPSTKGYVSRLPALSDAFDLSVYEPGNGDATRGIACGSGPCLQPDEVVVNEPAHRAYVRDSSGYAFHVYDTQTDQFVRSIGFPLNCSGGDVALDPATGKLYTLGSQELCAVSDGSPPVVTPIDPPDPTHSLDLLSPDSGSLYAATSYLGTIHELNTTTDAFVRTISTTPLSSMLALPGTGLLWVAHGVEERPALEVFDASGLKRALADLGGFPPGYDIAIGLLSHAGANRVALANNRHGTIAVIDPTLTGPDFQIDPAPLPGGTTAAAYPATTLSYTGGVGPVAWEIVSGALPPGLALDAATGAITGTPGQVGMYPILVRATDNGQSPPRVDVEDFQIQVLRLTVVTTALPGLTCSPTDVTLIAAGGRPPYTWSVQGAGLPAGLALDSQTGRLTGLPVNPLSCPQDAFTVAVRDANGTTATASFCLASAAPPALIGNALRLTRSLDELLLVASGLPAPPAGAGLNVYRSTDRGASWERLPTGSTGTLPPTTTTTLYAQAGGVSASPALAYYRMVAVDACGSEGAN